MKYRTWKPTQAERDAAHNPHVRWFYKGVEETNLPQHPTMFDDLLVSGRYKIQEGDSESGPWTDAEMRDDGSVWVHKQFTMCVPK